MTEQKRKRGRPKKVVVEPFNPSNLQKEVNNAYGIPNNPPSVETGRIVAFEPADQKVTVINPVSHQEAVELGVGMVTTAIKTRKESGYDPYQNPRFKSKNGLDKKS